MVRHRQPTTLEKLDLSDNSCWMGSDIIADLGQSLHSFHVLQEINLRDNPQIDAGLRELVQNIHKSHVKVLDISSCGISSATIEALTEATTKGPKPFRLIWINISYDTDISS